MATTIKDFLVSLGFNVDESGRKKFEKGLDSSTKTTKTLDKSLTALNKPLTLTGLGLAMLGKKALELSADMAASIPKFAGELNDLYYVSQRLGSSANNIKAFGQAFSSVGSNAETGVDTLGKLKHFFDSTAGGGEAVFQGWGVATRGANGELLKMEDVAVNLGKHLKEIPYYLALYEGAVAGLDEERIRAIMNPALPEQIALAQSKLAALGVELDPAKGEKFTKAMNDLTGSLHALADASKNAAVENALGPMEKSAQYLREALPTIAAGVHIIGGLWGRFWEVMDKTPFGATKKGIGMGWDNVKNILGPLQKNSELGGWISQIIGDKAEEPDKSTIPPPLSPNEPRSQMIGGRHNPGNIQNADGTFRRYGNDLEGLTAEAKLLIRYGQEGNDTINRIIAKWAPAAGKGNSLESEENYKRAMAQYSGYGRDQRLDFSNPAVLANFMKAQHIGEGTANPEYGNQINQAATAAITQTLNVTVTGVNDPVQAGNIIKSNVSDENRRLIRNFRNAGAV